MNGFGRGEDKNGGGKTSILTKETVGMTLLLFSLVALLILASGPVVFGDVGLAISAFFYGVCGYFVYPLLVLVFVLSLMLVAGKRFLPARVLVRTMLLLTAVFFIVHAATSERFFVTAEGAFASFGGYLGGCWTAATESAAAATGGGVLFAVVAYPVRFLLSRAGSYVCYSLLTAAALLYFLFLTPVKKLFFARKARPEKPKEKRPVRFEDLPASARPAPSDFRPRTPEKAAPRPAPAPASMPSYGEGRGESPYVRRAPASYGDPYASPRPETYRTAPPEPARPVSGRDLLFGSDPAENYRNNLIFDSTSYFNTRPRGSTVYPPKEGASSAEKPQERPAPPANAAPRSNYSGSFSGSAEAPRDPIPRRVRTVERDFRHDETSDYPAPYAGYEDLPYRPAEPEPPRIPDPEPPKETPASRLDDPASRFSDPARLDDPAAPASPLGESSHLDGPAEDFGRSSRLDDPAEDFGRSSRLDAPAESFGRETGRGDRLSRGESEGSFAAPADPYRRDDDPALRDPYRRDDDSDLRDPYRRDDDPALRDPYRRDDDPALRDPYRRDDDPDLRDPYGERGEEASRSADLFDSDTPDEGDYRAASDPFLDDGRREPPERGGRESFDSRAARGLRDLSDLTPKEPAAPMPEPTPPPMPEPQPAPAPKKKHIPKKYRRPNLGLFEQYDDTSEVSQEEIGRNSGVILDTLKSFKIEANIAKVTCGSTVTRYDIEIPKNVPVGMVIKRDTEIGMRLMVRDGVNMYVNNETGSVSIEVPNRKRATVGIRNVLSAPEYVNAKPGSLVFAMGKDIEGRNICGDIVKMKHLLVAGSTGSGKSVCLNTMLVSLICKYSPEELRLILIDPKRVEFAVYDGIPHLMINEIITDPPKAISALNWALKEMERRYGLFEQKTKSGGVTIQNVDQYNESLSEGEEKLCKIVIVFDELADFMMKAKKDIEERISMITAKARAAGIHAVIATQRPSVDIITGVIKGNLPTRIAFRTIQANDSRIILDEMGAEKLLGMGDMLYRTEGMFNCLRVQGAFLSNKEIHDIIADIKEHNESYYDEDVANFINQSGEGGGANPASFADDEEGGTAAEYLAALAVVVKRRQASISLIQRSCGVGYNHAGKIVEWMESMGYISPFDGAKARAVLLTKEEYEAKYGPLE